MACRSLYVDVAKELLCNLIELPIESQIEPFNRTNRERVMLSQGPIEDRLQIRELIDSYNNAVMRFDGETWASNWAEEGVWHLPGAGDVLGRDAILAVWQGAMSAFSFVGFFASAGPIIVEGDTAKGTWYQQELLHQKDGVKRSVTGRYEDDYVKQGGRWFFQKRIYEVLNVEVTEASNPEG